ncbi:MAG: hypothetical protein MK008_11155, partial [Bdellovibrionales bacterium]|nr:hypothetical protein [Bdellovibrionales bacterium]
MITKNKFTYILLSGLVLIMFQNCGDYRFKSNSLSKSSSETICDNTTNCTDPENNNEQSTNDDQVLDGNNDQNQSSPNIDSFDFYDSFESGDMNKTNNFGFNWERNNRTSIVRDDQYAVWNNGAILNGPVTNRQWEGKTGQHSLRFRYPSGDY